MYRQLTSKGHKVFIIDSNRSYLNFNHELYSNYYKDILYRQKHLLNKAKIITCDLKNIFDLSSVVEKIKPDVVVHLAALPLANLSNTYSQEAVSSIIETTTNFLEILKKIKFNGKFIYTSSSMVYGEFNNKIVTEESATKPMSIYGSAKLAGEIITKGFCESFGLKYSIIRPSAVYGPTDVNRRVVQIFMENALKGKQIIVNGPNSKIDFTYVEDLVQGYEKVINSNRSENQIFNITRGNARTLIDLAKIIQKYFPELRVIKQEHEKGVPKRGTLSISKAKKVLKFSPKFDLETGIQDYFNYYKFR
tara:strand:+ start:9 stop:926 length:918 start_codon:yes stop_codon:yes gene_type:complete